MDKLEQRIEKIENRMDAVWKSLFNPISSEELNKNKVVFEYSDKVESKNRFKILCEVWNKYKEQENELHKYLLQKGDVVSHSIYKGLTITVIECTNEIEFQGVIIKEYSGLPQLKLGDIIVVCNSQHFKKV